MKLNFLSIFAITALLATPAWALDLHGARASGQVGEKIDGYVAALQPSGEVDALVKDVNDKRRAEYARISKENGQTPDVVGKLAAEEIIKNLPAGSSYQGSDGGWRKR